MTKTTLPSIPLTDKRFEYVPASHTDIRARFRRIEQERQRAAFENVTRINARKP